MKNLLTEVSQSKWYWVFLLISGILFEAVALYQQYVLDEWPCVLCIHIRIWIIGIILLSLLALVVRPGLRLSRMFHIITVVMAIGLAERSWQVLAVERGWTFSECNMESGLPAWFALDKWFPLLFEVKTSCGYTPYIFMQISVAEILMLSSVCLLLVSLSLTVVSWLKH